MTRATKAATVECLICGANVVRNKQSSIKYCPACAKIVARRQKTRLQQIYRARELSGQSRSAFRPRGGTGDKWVQIKEPEKLADYIYFRGEELNLMTTAAVARKCGIGVSVLTTVEGLTKQSLHTDTVARLAHGLEISVDAFKRCTGLAR